VLLELTRIPLAIATLADNRCNNVSTVLGSGFCALETMLY
jgi:hypothetical protein